MEIFCKNKFLSADTLFQLMSAHNIFFFFFFCRQKIIQFSFFFFFSLDFVFYTKYVSRNDGENFFFSDERLKVRKQKKNSLFFFLIFITNILSIQSVKQKTFLQFLFLYLLKLMEKQKKKKNGKSKSIKVKKIDYKI